ncbi:hypothetical protein HGO92_08940 [Arthrobacter sp. SF27]|nr:hypothetical protein [Arthrobacter sp. SF27]NMR29814.1 hypothetical protein [Arthrobacter sp. SF27]
MDFLRGAAPGTRVVVRYRIDDGVTDALGYLVSLDATECTVRTRRGDVVVPLDRVEAAKEVPPPPAPRAPRQPAP